MHLTNKVTSELITNTNHKFELWDEAIKNNLLDGSEDDKKVFYELLKDPTIYMYAFFKNKDDGPMKLYAYQDVIINDQHPKVMFAAANQIGKSVCLCCKALQPQTAPFVLFFALT